MNMSRSELQQGKALLSKVRKLIKTGNPRKAIKLMLEAFPIKQPTEPATNEKKRQDVNQKEIDLAEQKLIDREERREQQQSNRDERRLRRAWDRQRSR